MLNFVGVQDQDAPSTNENKLNELLEKIKDDDHGFVSNKDPLYNTFVRVNFNTPEARAIAYRNLTEESEK